MSLGGIKNMVLKFIPKHISVLNFACGISFIVCLVTAGCFLHGRNPWHWNGYVLNTEIVGHYGDFIGGFIGTLLSVILLYYTLYLQREDSANNSKVYKKQQLNDDFYHLMSLYQDTLKTLSFSNDDPDFKLYGKEALHSCLDELRLGFDESQQNSLRKKAVLLYLDFYAYYRDFAPISSRTLYRMCEMLCNQEDNSDSKNVELVKILRSQLSDAELVLMRYNVQTRMGKKFQRYVNRFNLLKHLPPLDLLEFKKYRNVLNDKKLISLLNVVLVELRQKIEDILDQNSNTYFTVNEYQSLVSISVKTSNDRDKLELMITRKPLTVLPNFDPLNCFQKFDDNTLKELMEYFLYDCFILHNFQMYNIRKEIEFKSSHEDMQDKKRFSSIVENKMHKSLNMTWNQYSKSLAKAKNR